MFRRDFLIPILVGEVEGRTARRKLSFLKAPRRESNINRFPVKKVRNLEKIFLRL